MAEVHRLQEHRRELISENDGSALRATWHREAGYVVLSLWRGDTCVATSHLTPREAGHLANFLTSGLTDLAHGALTSGMAVTAIVSQAAWHDRVRGGVTSWMDSVGWSLERLARRLRSGV